MNPHTMLVRLFYNSHSFINRIRDRIVDKKLGIQTYCLDLEINDRNIYYGYAPTPYQSLKILFAHFPFDDKDVFIDFGCGRRRVAIYASIYGCKKVYGIDINDYMIEKANDNLLQLKKETTNINFIKQDALQFEITPDINKFKNPSSINYN